MTLFYFGCWHEAGHYVWTSSKQRLYRSSTTTIPFEDRYLDGGFLLPRPEKFGDGTINIVNGWTIVAWWGSPWDKRGGVNSAIMAQGRYGFEEMWNEFQKQFPSLNIIPKPSIKED